MIISSRMFAFHCPSHAKHCPVTHIIGEAGVPHVEQPRRADCVLETLKTIDCLQLRTSEREATDEELQTAHDPKLINFVTNAYKSLKDDENPAPEVVPELIGCIANGVHYLPKKVYLQSGHFAIDYATPIGPHTGEQARKSAALAIDGAKQLLADPTTPVVSICRPPGHHATREKYGGYCYYNNAALAAEVLKGNGLVCILDIDYHHGNGTQSIYYERDDVLYISIHADPEYEYPFYSGGAEETGIGKGEGFNINLPLPAGTDWSNYSVAFYKAVEAIKEKGVKTLIVSFGADAAAGDPICQFLLYPENYTEMGKALKSLGLPSLIVMEGGYSANEILGPVVKALVEQFTL